MTFKCPVCKSEGFERSITGYGCSFCDGTEGGQEPSLPDTPCVAVCTTTFDEVCRGCGRTYLEVAHWVSMPEEERRVVWERITAQGYPRRN